ncbi:sugar phosphate nucleotidyltransferase [Terribacillus saccharophilus]|uniref:Mannose-1-phosphate guanylyltransferase n=1 Tax=Terribacillus saccharophilus TaxID=361277 RepID=A0A268AEU6_9BACI|nr:sugar phosphate nucleotidyltransferase [Terribacillus saccharophilus]PAD22646.1 mannose-1-phosphate guanylyltransferase [Terribacillus saccharophilus]
MKLILLSGGSGKRLWPLSNDARSKQFLKVLKNEKGQYESMVQRVFNQLRSLNLEKDTIIATSSTQVEMIKNQLGEGVTIISEPSRRDTFPAIALSIAYINDYLKADKDEIVAVLPVDPFVDTNFFNKVKDLEELIQTSNADLALIGIKPTFASEKYGYIAPKESTEEKYSLVDNFIEKPKQKIAEDLISRGALWNSGVFAFRVGYLEECLASYNIPLNYDFIYSNYENLVKTSFDYAVVEEAENIVVTKYEGYWKDLGTWNTLTEEMATSTLGIVNTLDTQNTHVINELGIPVSVMGLENVIIAASPDGILVTTKKESPKIKELMKDHTALPMYEERSWGNFKVIDFSKFGNHEVVTKYLNIIPGKNLSLHTHNSNFKNWTVINGEGILLINGVLKTLRKGDIIQIKGDEEHAVKAISKLEIIEVQQGDSLSNQHIEIIESSWMKMEEKIFASN